jgi:hypothetical protein
MDQMRLLKLLPCLVLGACSSFLDDAPQKEDLAPLISSSAEALKAAATAEKLSAPLEVAGPIQANAISIAPWIICLRSSATEQSRQQVYSVLFRDGKFDSVRPSAIVDRCEVQNFMPLQIRETTPIRQSAQVGHK